MVVPASVKEIGEGAFCKCRELREITFEDGSQLRTIGKRCFEQSGLEEVFLPKSLQCVGEAAFSDCDRLEAVYLDDECGACLFGAEIPDSTRIGPLPSTKAGDMYVWSLRE